MMFSVLLIALVAAQAQAQNLFKDDQTALFAILAIGGAYEAIDFDMPETPITIRLTDYIQAVDWNCVAVYSEDYKDALTKKRPRVKIDPAKHNLDSKVLCALQATVTLSQNLYKPLSLAQSSILETQLNLPNTQAEYPEVTACRTECNEKGFCFDKRCLRRLGRDTLNPLVVGQVVAHFALDFASRDGYNANGNETLSCTGNCRPFADTTGYRPVNTPWDKGNGKEHRWQPLLEDDGRGFFFYQQHVTPHVGRKAKLRILSNQERRARTTPDPEYDYDHESELLMERLNNLDERKKAEVEFFNNKLEVDKWIRLSALPVLPDITYDEATLVAVALTAIERDAMIMAWKEKVRHDLVRPTTWIQNMEDGEKILNTYGGPGKGTEEIKSKDFQPFIRVMPHSEYPSGSSCICTAVNDFVIEYFKYKNMEDVPIPIYVPIKQGSSKVEPGVLPSEDIVLAYPDWKTYAQACGQSRLNGGQHFTAAVTAGEKLVEGMGKMAVDYAIELTNGALPKV